ncbi:unnamed protein product [Notodromas monacha]|uniref:Serine carboxypeptidase n=1 Tax=Notodromas monacha TaxID=399045 RepID=A0A7R9BSS2_9CRUS|nr:unnamed protein product [Notodromas monacha]CAG0919655.1 unnamed protein product [Notodromas monacha]
MQSQRESGNTSAPLLLWLNGGPGTSSLLGVLAETGPIRFDPDSLEPKLADTPAWTDDFDVLYIDQPVGTGFSYASNADGFATSQEEIVLDLFEAFQQFFQLFPEYYEKPLYLTGISYAGKYVPWLAVRVHDENQKPETRQYPLEGIVTINGFTDPTSAFSDTAQFLYQHGLVDRNGEAQIQEGAEILAQATELEDWLTAVLIIADFGNNETGLLNNLTGYTQMYNVADPYDQGLPPGTWEIYPEFVNQPKIRDAIHVGQTPFGGGYDVQASLLLDFPQSAKNKLVTILNNNYKVLLLNGAIDLVLGPRTCTSLLNSSNDWRDLDLYQQSKQEILKDETGSVVGYLTKVRNMWQAKVLGGTHYAPANVPGPVYSILKEFIAASSIGR